MARVLSEKQIGMMLRATALYARKRAAELSSQATKLLRRASDFDRVSAGLFGKSVRRGMKSKRAGGKRKKARSGRKIDMRTKAGRAMKARQAKKK